MVNVTLSERNIITGGHLLAAIHKGRRTGTYARCTLQYRYIYIHFPLRSSGESILILQLLVVASFHLPLPLPLPTPPPASLSERAVSEVSRAFPEHFPSRAERRASQAVSRSTLFDQAVLCARETPRWIFLMSSPWVAKLWLPEYPLASFGHICWGLGFQY